MTPTLALDLGTKTGWAYLDSEGNRSFGTWHLDKESLWDREFAPSDLLDVRVLRLRMFLRDLIGQGVFPGNLWYEDVQFSLYTYQTMLWASFRTVVWLHAADWGWKVHGLPVGTLKKAGAGHGAATKGMMAKALARKEPGLTFDVKGRLCEGSRIVDDNEVDARHLLTYGTTQRL